MDKKRKKKIIGWSVGGGIALALAIFLLIWYFGISYPQFDGISRKEFEICGLDDGISPQGLCSLPENEGGFDFAMCGYMGKDASRVYLINSETGENRYFTVSENGVENRAHFGGLTCTQTDLYVTGDAYLLRLPLASAISAENGACLEITDKFATGIQNAYTETDGVYLYAGEFYRPGNYETHPSHHISVEGGMNYARIYAYRLDAGSDCGIASTVPEKVISVREEVQGVAVYDGGIVLSVSYGLKASELYVYRNILGGTAQSSVTLDTGEEVPLYILDGSNLVNVIRSPSMSEEVCVSGDRLYVQFESGCNKYKYFTHTRYRNVYSVALSDLTK